MKYILDTHCHTIASGHAYSTLQEMVKSAADKGLELIAITDHAPAMPGSTYIFYFNNLVVVPSELYGVEVLKGVEANIIDYNGNIDMDKYSLSKMDIVIASLHPPCIHVGTIEENTNAIIGAIRNPYINIIGHLDDGRFPVDYEKIVKEAKNNKILLELNNTSLDPKGVRLNSRENAITLLELCKQYEQPIVFGSDAHFFTDVGNFNNAISLIEEINFPKELIVNHSVKELKKYLKLF